MENEQEKSQEKMVKEAVEEARKAAGPAGDAQEEEASGQRGGASGDAQEGRPETGQPEEAASDPEKESLEADGDDGEGPCDEEPKEGRRLFGKKDKKDKKDEKIAELSDRVTRQMAEFDNFRKRTEKEKSQMYEIGAKDIIEKILPVVDNFERGLKGVGEEEKDNPFVQGMEMIYKQLMTMLEDAGVKPIEAIGQEFDPEFHNAVMHVEDENLGENVVAEELQRGYLYRDSVVRHSMVKVAN